MSEISKCATDWCRVQTPNMFCDKCVEEVADALDKMYEDEKAAAGVAHHSLTRQGY